MFFTCKVDDPFSLLFRELKYREEALRQETIFLKDDQGYLYRLLGLKENQFEIKPCVEKVPIDEKDYHSFVQNIEGLIGVRLGENLEPILMDGAVEEVTGYGKEDFFSGQTG